MQTAPTINVSRASKTLCLAIAQKTIAGDAQAFQGLYDVLKQAFPNVFKLCEIQHVTDSAMLMYLRGSHALEPLLFSGHLDVVPAAQETLDSWDFPPFAGVIADGYIWGRGAMDMKGHVIALLEALEETLESGFHPQRDIWIALSGNLEVRGGDAQKMFRILKAQGVRPAFVLDEGPGVMPGQWGVNEPMALIGIGEKGYVNLSITASSLGGHGAYPPKATALEKVAKAVAILTTLPLGLKHISPALVNMLQSLAPYQKGLRRFAFGNPKLMKSYIISLLEKTDFGRAFLMTTVAVTTAKGSTAVNTLPEAACVTLNCRIIQGDTAEKVRKRAELRVRNNDVTLSAASPADPTRMSPAQGPAWDALATAVSVHFPKAIPVPCLIPCASDARSYEGLCDAIYRFSPFEITLEEQRQKHGVNERLSLANLEKGICFFMQMLKA